MGLIAREIERRGVPTVCLTSALSITRAVGAPRAVFLDFPLGHTAGRAGEPGLQREVVRAALRAFEEIREPGGVVELPFAWADDGDAWKEGVMRVRGPGDTDDERRGRSSEPQYQNEEDRRLAEAALASGGCAGCVWLDGQPRRGGT